MRKVIVTISREYASGGREIGRLLAEKLNVSFYDKELLTYLAENSGIDEDLFKEANANIGFENFYFNDRSKSGRALHSLTTLRIHERIQAVQEKLIQKLAQDSCVIIGRCSDYILRNDPNVIKVFIRGDLQDKKKRATNMYGEPIDRVNERLLEVDVKRANYYNYFTDRVWGKPSNYDLIINSAKLSLEDAVEVICTFIENRK